MSKRHPLLVRPVPSPLGGSVALPVARALPLLVGLAGVCAALGFAVVHAPLIASVALAAFLALVLLALTGPTRITHVALAGIPILVLLIDLTPRLTLTLSAAATVLLLLATTPRRFAITTLTFAGVAMFLGVVFIHLIQSSDGEQVVEAAKYLLFPAMAVVVSTRAGRDRLTRIRWILLGGGLLAMAIQGAAILLHAGPSGAYYGAGEQLGLTSESPHELALIGVTVAIACLIAIEDVRWRLTGAAIAALPALATAVRSALIAFGLAIIPLVVHTRFKPSTVVSIVLISGIIVFSGVGSIVAARYEKDQKRGEFSSVQDFGFRARRPLDDDSRSLRIIRAEPRGLRQRTAHRRTGRGRSDSQVELRSERPAVGPLRARPRRTPGMVADLAGNHPLASQPPSPPPTCGLCTGRWLPRICRCDRLLHRACCRLPDRPSAHWSGGLGMNRDALYTEGQYLRDNSSWHVEDSPWKARNIITMMERHALAPSSVCEVGCGAGEILRQLCDRYPATNFVGYDISPQAIALARERAHDGLSFRQADLLGEDVHFDLLICADVFEHVEDYLGFLRALHGRASTAIFHIPLDVSVLNVLRSGYIRRARDQLGHLHHFTADTALSTLRLAGYEPLDWFYTAGAIELPHGGTLGRLINVPRRLGRRVSPAATARLLGGFSLMVLAS